MMNRQLTPTCFELLKKGSFSVVAAVVIESLQ